MTEEPIICESPPSFTAPEPPVQQTVFAILAAMSVSHLLNDIIQSLIPAIYPLLKTSYGLNFTQVGLITLTFQMTASLLQPFIGFFTDRRPIPYSLAAGMAVTLAGLVMLSRASSFPLIIESSALVGLGSAIFHPEASRLARMASGGRHGFAQSLFQLGGNAGSSLGPLLAAAVVVPHGQGSVLWFGLIALVAIVVLAGAGKWYRDNLSRVWRNSGPARDPALAPLPRARVLLALGVLIVLIFSKYFYLACFTSYYTFYLIAKFHTGVQMAQIYLFIFLFAVAAGTMVGGYMGDRFGRKKVIWVSILGAAPFSLALPCVGLFWTAALSIVIGMILSSAFSAILVYATDLVPGKIGLISGLFFGLAFGMAGIGSALLGRLADHTSIAFVFQVCSFLPLLGLATGLLPDIERPSHPFTGT